VFVSRWDGGSVIEADFAQLEFRVAAQLSGDETATDEINNNFDVHSYTASVITEAGQPVTRQQAKEHTFAPLFGATGFGRTPAEARYYENFLVKYRGIAQWHGSLAKEVMEKGYVTTPSGRQFAFPDAKRLPSGGITGFTMVKNYPVQSAATDIVQTTLLLLEKNMRLRNLRSILVNSVHDNAVIDVYPQEEKAVLSVINDTVDTLPSEIYGRFNMKLHVPLEVETKVGKNWMEMQEMT
jgi:DNA polymerase-1